MEQINKDHSQDQPAEEAVSQDELWNEVGEILKRHWTIQKVKERLKSEFTIRRTVGEGQEDWISVEETIRTLESIAEHFRLQGKEPMQETILSAINLLSKGYSNIKMAYTKGWQDRSMTGERTEFNEGAFDVRLAEFLKTK